MLAWAVWLLIDLLFPPALSESYSSTISLVGIAGLTILLLPLSVELSVRIARRSLRLFLRFALVGLAAGLLFLLPYVLWLYNALTTFTLATGLSLALGAATLAAGLWMNCTGEV